MGSMKNLRLSFAEDLVNRGVTLDLDKAFVMVDELWDDAMINHDKKSINKLNRLVKRYEKGLM